MATERYDELVKEFEARLGRSLNKKEQDFILWIVNEQLKYSIFDPHSAPS